MSNQQRQQRVMATPGEQGGREPEPSRTGTALTPGRAPAEGPEIESPSHERWEQDTYDRAPAEGADFEE